jgi:hypothetical protein
MFTLKIKLNFLNKNCHFLKTIIVMKDTNFFHLSLR